MIKQLSLLLALILALPAARSQNVLPLNPTREEVQQDLFGASATPLSRTAMSLEYQSQPSKKKAAVGAIYSLLLPGMGELYADNFASGRYFLAAEGVLWLAYAVLQIQGNAYADDARVFAVSRAGVNPAGKDDQFWVDVGNFIDAEKYNEKKARDREPDRIYNLAAGYNWKWDSDASRAIYRNDRITSENMYNNRKFVVIGLVINHIASAINAARATISYNRSIEEQTGELSINAGVMGGAMNPHGVMLTFIRTF